MNKDQELDVIRGQFAASQKQIDELEGEQRSLENERRAALALTIKERRERQGDASALAVEDISALIDERRAQGERERQLPVLITGLKMEQERLRARENELSAAAVEEEIQAARRVELEAIEAFKQAENHLKDCEQRRTTLESRRTGLVFAHARHRDRAEELAVTYTSLLDTVR